MNEKDTIDAIADALRSDPDFANVLAQSRAAGDDAGFDAAIAAALGVAPAPLAPPQKAVGDSKGINPPGSSEQPRTAIAAQPTLTSPNPARPSPTVIHRPAGMQAPVAPTQRLHLELVPPKQPEQPRASPPPVDPLAQFRPQTTQPASISSATPTTVGDGGPVKAEANTEALKAAPAVGAAPAVSLHSPKPAVAPNKPEVKSMTETALTASTTAAEEAKAPPPSPPVNAVAKPEGPATAALNAASKAATSKPASGGSEVPTNSVETLLEKAEILWKEAEGEATKADLAKASAAKAGTPAAKDAAAVALRKAEIAWKAAIVETQMIASAKTADNAPSTWSKEREANVDAARKRAEGALTAAGVSLNPPAVAKPAVAKPAVAKAPSFPDTRPAKAEGAAKPKARRKKLTAFKLSFLLAVLLPTALVGLYYLLIASDQYRSEMRFAVRGTERSPLENLGLSVLPGASSSASDAYIVIDYVHSKQVLVDIQKKTGIDIRKYFSEPGIDFAYQIDPKMPLEKFISYWRWMIDASFNSTTSITTFEITAFSAEDARAIAAAVLKASDELVNELSAKARTQLISTAQSEVARTEQRLVEARQAIANFQSTELTADPSLVAQSNQELASGIEKQLIELNARRTFLMGSVDENSPSIRVLDRQIASIAEQLKAKRQEIGLSGELPGESKPLSRQLSEFNALMVEKEFAEKAYTTSLAALETSQAEARRQERYFAIVVEPSNPGDCDVPSQHRQYICGFRQFLCDLAAGVSC